MAENAGEIPIDALGLFVEEVHALLTLDFVHRLNADRGSVRVRWQGREPVGAPAAASDPRALHAARRILRFLEDKEDPTSVGNMDPLFEKLPVSLALRTRFTDLRVQTEDYLDTIAVDAPVLYSGHVMTRRDLLSIFVEGGLARQDAGKRALFEGLCENAELFAMLEGAFLETLASLCLGLTHLASLCDQALTEIVEAS